jgi:diaminopimelate epimerase
MKIRFTKMQGAGNDFVVLDETGGRLNLSDGASTGFWRTGISASAPTRS